MRQHTAGHDRGFAFEPRTQEYRDEAVLGDERFDRHRSPLPQRGVLRQYHLSASLQAVIDVDAGFY